MSIPFQPQRILILSSDQKLVAQVSSLVREVVDAQIDTLSGISGVVDNRTYHLVVIESMGHSSDFVGALERIKRQSPVTSVIVIANRGTTEEAVSAVKLGAEDYFNLPLRPESFRLAVKRGLDKKAVFSENSGASHFLMLLNSCQLISATLEQSKIFNIVQSYFSRELKSNYSAIYNISDGHPVRVETGSVGEQKSDRALLEVMDIALSASNSVAQMTTEGVSHRFVERGKVTPGLFIFRFKCVSNAEFICVSLSPEKPANLESFESRIRMLRTQIELTGKNIERYQGAQNLAFLDDATGLYNTRYLYNLLEKEITQAKQAGRSFAILFVDGDRFKSINDRFGHLAGTKLLHELGNVLKNALRGHDTVFRYGGDEFVALISPSDLQAAQAIAERVRKAVEKHLFLEDEGLNIQITVSIGVALFPDHAQTVKDVIDAADHAMYSAKKKSRNFVFLAPIPKQDAGHG